MWLVNARTLDLDYCDSPSRDIDLDTYLHNAYSSGSAHGILPYAILSHRSEAEEVTFSDMKDRSSRQKKQGWQKIERACQQALQDSIGHIWIDTCCINKDSETELSESIKSMYAYYQQAQVCYVYLFDYEAPQAHDLGRCSWFTRGWTLQELVAPKTLHFFDKTWTWFGDKTTLRATLSNITNIDTSLLEGKSTAKQFSVGQRMSWAALRRTTRAEDRAYSLLGIFDVDIPTNYGEGGLRAFARLQQAIIASTEDATIYAWHRKFEPSNYGMMALAPDAFQESASLRVVHTRKSKAPPVLTSRGLHMTIAMTPWRTDTYLAILDCASNDLSPAHFVSPRSYQLAIFLRKLHSDDTFARVSVDDADRIERFPQFMQRDTHFEIGFREVPAYIRQGGLTRSEEVLLTQRCGYGYRVSDDLLGLRLSTERLTRVITGKYAHYDEKSRVFFRAANKDAWDSLVTLDLRPSRVDVSLLRLFLDWDFNPLILIATPYAIGQTAREATRTRLWNELAEWTPSDNHEWAELKNIGGKVHARHDSQKPGVWKLKGDRLQGLDVQLTPSGDNMHLRVWKSPIKVGRETLVFWHVELYGTKSGIAEYDLLSG